METYIALFNDVFAKTDDLLVGSIANEENVQASHILYYLSLFACYLKGPDEAAYFKQKWLAIKERVKSISDFDEIMNQARMMEDHIEQSLRSESVHDPKHPDNPGIYQFYENIFPQLYAQAVKAKEDFLAHQNNQFAYVQRLEADNEFFFAEAEKNPRVWFLISQ